MPDAIALVKFGQPDFLEWWRWDSDYIYHHEDRSDGLDQPYHFSPDDRWIPRRWKVGDVLDCRQGNTLRRTADEGRTWSVRPWAYTMTLAAAFARYPCGGDIGDAAVMVVEYDPTYSLSPRRGFVERFWFAEGWGWWRWQSFRLGQAPGFEPPDKNMRAWNISSAATRIQRRRAAMLASDALLSAENDELIDVQFNQLGGTRVMPIQPVRPWPQSAEQPLVTITDWQPRTGAAPLMVRVTMERSGGPATFLTALADGRRPFVIPDPPRISEVTFAFDRPGTYALRAVVEGPSGRNETQTPRFVTVTEGEEPEVPETQPYPSEPEYWQSIVLRDTMADYAEANKPLDAFYPIWTARTAYDIGAKGLTKDASWKLHRNEMRVKLGLPALPVDPSQAL